MCLSVLSRTVLKLELMFAAQNRGYVTKSATARKWLERFDAIWRLTYSDVGPVVSAYREIIILSIAVWPQCTNVRDRQQRDRVVTIPTHCLGLPLLPAMSRQKCRPSHRWTGTSVKLRKLKTMGFSLLIARFLMRPLAVRIRTNVSDAIAKNVQSQFSVASKLSDWQKLCRAVVPVQHKPFSDTSQ